MARFVLGIPLSFLFTFYWPIARSQSLASVPGRAGALNAVMSMWGFVPITLLVGLLAEWITLTTTTLWISVVTLLLLLLMIGRLPLTAAPTES